MKIFEKFGSCIFQLCVFLIGGEYNSNKTFFVHFFRQLASYRNIPDYDNDNDNEKHFFSKNNGQCLNISVPKATAN